MTMSDTAMRSLRKERALAHGLALVAIVMICAGFLMPFVWMVSTSLKTLEDTMAFPPVWVPSPVALENYPAVLTSDKVSFARFMPATRCGSRGCRWWAR